MSVPVTIDQAAQTVGALDADLRAGKLDPTRTKNEVERLHAKLLNPKKARIPRKPVYGLWTPIEWYSELLAAERDAEGWPLRDAQILAACEQLTPHAGRLQPSSCNTCLGTPEQTATFLCTWIAKGQRKAKHNPFYKWPEVQFDADHFNYADGVTPLAEPCIQAVGLDLEPYRGSSPDYVRGEDGVPANRWAGFDGFVLLGLNPQIVPKMGTEIPNFWLPAFKANWPGGSDWRHVLGFDWSGIGRRLSLRLHYAGCADPGWSVLVRRES